MVGEGVMLITGIVLMAIGSVGLGGAVVMEIVTGEPTYKILTKVFPWVFGVGAVILAVAFSIVR